MVIRYELAFLSRGPGVPYMTVKRKLLVPDRWATLRRPGCFWEVYANWLKYPSENERRDVPTKKTCAVRTGFTISS